MNATSGSPTVGSLLAGTKPDKVALCMGDSKLLKNAGRSETARRE